MHIITHKGCVSKQELIERLLRDYNIDTTPRTFERDLKNLKDNFGIEISYNRAQRGYLLVEEDYSVHRFLKFAEFSSLTEIYEEGMRDYSSFNKYVIPDDSSAFTGLHNMPRILKAITLSRKLTFRKKNYLNKTSKTYTVTPLRLKEYLKRWYLIAVPEGIEDIRSFGLDRITHLQVTDKKAQIKKSFEKQIEAYDDVVGLNFDETDEVQRVTLSVESNQLKYLKSLPLHKSQVCLDSGDDWETVSYKLKPNYELEMQLLKMGEKVVVIEPKWLREKMKNRINEMMSNYV